MTEDEILLTVEEKMEKAISVLKENLAGIRTGRANPGLVESIKVEAYGTSVPLKQLAAVGAPEPQQLVIRPYDP
ncbi:MAG: ribosome recycling factor, partial [Thermogutta sp.]